MKLFWKKFRQTSGELEARVAERTAELAKANEALAAETSERKRAEGMLRESELRFQTLIDAVPQQIWTALPDGALDFFNQRLDFFGRTHEQMIGWGWKDVIHPEDLARCAARWSHSLTTGEPYEIEFRLKTVDGNYLWHLGRARALRDAAGRITKWFGTNTDISERMQAEGSLRESEERLRHLVACNPAVIFALKFVPGGMEPTWVSENHRQFTGHHPGQETSRAWWIAHLHPDDRDRVLTEESAPFPNDRLITEYRFRRQDGTYFWIRDEKVIIRDAEGNPLEMIGSLVNITDLKQTQEALQSQQTELRLLFDFLPALIMIKDTKNRILRVNQRVADSLGKSIEEIEGSPTREFYPDNADKYYKDDLEVIDSGTPKLGIVETFRDKDGKDIWIRTNKVPYCDQDGEAIGVVVLSEDITEQRRAEEALRLIETRLFQSQKLETVGKLAGGIAHEFNSIMTAIIGQSELLLVDLPKETPLRHNAAEIRKAADRAAALTRQLLAYGRKQILQPEILDLNSVLSGMENVLRHLSGQIVNLRIVQSTGLQTVKVDAGQIEQVIMNVAMNAIDAMPHGGNLTLETANATLDQDYANRFPELMAGEYVMLAITDTGVGMNQEVEGRIFEPFFSTKGVGKGTGLGLATSYGILKQSGGHINVYSEPGRGATFKIYLPQVGAWALQPAATHEPSEMPGGRETIMLVEDDPALREMAGALLRRLGYTVWTAANGIEALSAAHLRGRGHIDLLFTDLVMPHMSGKELSDRIRSISPGTVVLFTSAYPEHAIVHQGVLEAGVALLQKPFTPMALARKVREMLDREISQGGGAR